MVSKITDESKGTSSTAERQVIGRELSFLLFKAAYHNVISFTKKKNFGMEQYLK